jgi:hypothetical protein
MTQCVEVEWAGGTVLAILGIVRDWEEITAGAKSVERIDELSGWREFRSVFRVEPVEGPARHYLVTEG